MNTQLDTSSKIAIFRGKHIRKTIHNGEWYFSIVDIIIIQSVPSPPSSEIRNSEVVAFLLLQNSQRSSSFLWPI